METHGYEAAGYCFETLKVGGVLFALTVSIILKTAHKMPVCSLLLTTNQCPPLFLFHFHHLSPPPSLTFSKLHSSSQLYSFLLLCCPPSGGCQGPAGGRAAGSGTQPGPV